MVFLPGTRDEMKGKKGQQLLEHGILRLCITLLMLHEVQIVVYKQGRKICPQQQAVAPAHKDGLHYGKLFYGLSALLCHDVVVRCCSRPAEYNNATPPLVQAQNSLQAVFVTKRSVRRKFAIKTIVQRAKKRVEPPATQLAGLQHGLHTQQGVKHT